MWEGNQRVTSRRGKLFLAVLAGLIGWIYFASEHEIQRRYVVPLPPVGAPAHSGETAQVAGGLLERGRHLVTVVAQCQFCHGMDLGGRVIADDPFLGRIDASNLTRGTGGIANRYTRRDWENAIRYGVRPDRGSLVLMPSIHLAHLAPDDLDAIIDYVLSVPPVDRVQRERAPGWVARTLIALGQVDDIFSAKRGLAASDPIRSDLAGERATGSGAYLVEIGNCRVCHGMELGGGLHPLALPGEPEPPALMGRRAMDGWTFADFSAAMRAGRTPTGRVLDPDYMPWPGYSGLADEEVLALWRFLKGDEG